MGGARLLVVDDEAPLLELLRKYLERLGYRVDACISAEQAWDLFDADPSGYSLVITDLTLPGTSGEDLLVRMRARHPALRAIVSTGYPHVPQSPRTGFVQKPFLPKTLAAEIERILKTG